MSRRRRRHFGGSTSNPNAYAAPLIRDLFTDVNAALADGNCVPGAGHRDITTATGTNISTDGTYMIAGGSSSWGADKYVEDIPLPRLAGRVLQYRVIINDRQQWFYHGLAFNNTVAGEPSAGLGFENFDGYIYVLTPGGKVRIGASGNLANLHPCEYLFTIWLNDRGACWFISTFANDSVGGTGVLRDIVIPQYPSMALVYVDNADAHTSLYPFGSFYDAARHRFKEFAGIESGVAADGWATFADRFGRADGALGNNWTTESGTWVISSGKVIASVIANPRSIVYQSIASSSDGWFCWTVTPPGSGAFNVGCLFRRAGTNDAIIFGSSGAGFALARIGGTTISSSGAGTPFAAGVPSTVVIRAEGNKYQIVVTTVSSGVITFDSGVITDSGNQNLSGTGIGFREATGNTTCSYDDVAYYPLTVTAPALLQVGYTPSIFTPGATLASDTFTGTNGTTLPVHDAAWILDANSGVWTLNNGKATVALNSGNNVVYRDVGAVNVEISVDITQPSNVETIGEVFDGLAVRYINADNFVYCRLAADHTGQPGFDEFEIWQRVAGAEDISKKAQWGLSYKNNATMTLKVQVVGNLLHMFYDGGPRLTIIMSDVFASATKCGLYRQSADAGAVFDNFVVKALS